MKIMNPVSLSLLVNSAFQHVIKTTKLHKMDESHGLKHSMEVFGFAKRIYEIEVKKNPFLEDQQGIIFAAAIGHDTCDKKYMNETQGVLKYKEHMSDIMSPEDLEIVGNIISTMSYSKVKTHGFPELGIYQLAYHIVREADLLAAYDIDRCIMYKMHRDNCDYIEAFTEALELFDYRVFKMRKDKLFITAYSKKESLKLHRKAIKEINCLKTIL